MANIAVIGLGYVGATTAACFAEMGHRVYGVDISREKVDAVNRGVPPVNEPGLAECLGKGVSSGRVTATVAIEEALKGVDIAVVCVGTPTSNDGGVDLSAVIRVSLQIGAVIPDRTSRLDIVMRSTVPPGSCDDQIAPAVAKAAGALEGDGWSLVHNPEFLREGVAIADFFDPEVIVMGGDPATATAVGETLYSKLDAPTFAVTRRESEMVKYAANAFHAAKVGFANELGRLSRVFGIDGRTVMEILVQDTRLNISPKYLRPGFAYGGSCLPKDLRGLLWMGAENGVPLPMLAGIEASNSVMIDQAMADVTASEPSVVGLVGLAFKDQTDDLRESPLLEVAGRLTSNGVKVRIFDPNVSPATMNGQNRAIADQMLPGWSEMLVSELSGLNGSDVIVVGRRVDPKQIQDWLDEGLVIVDLDGSEEVPAGEGYTGAGW